MQVYGNDVTDLLEGGGLQAVGAWSGVAAAAVAQVKQGFACWSLWW